MSKHKRMTIKWSDKDRQDFTDKKLRAQTIPPKDKPLPEADEWDEDVDPT